MTAIAVMLAAGALCLWGAVASRSVSGAAASAVMLAAMVDHALVHAVLPVVWGTVLGATGMLLGARLRRGRGRAAACGGAGAQAGHGSGAGAAALPAIACAVSYPVMGLLLLVHGGAPAQLAGSGAQAHAGHGGHGGHGAGILAVLPTVAACALAVGLLALALRAAVERRGATAVETGGMSVMLVAMLV